MVSEKRGFSSGLARIDPPKSPFLRGTLTPVPPFLRGARGDQVLQQQRVNLYSIDALISRAIAIAGYLKKVSQRLRVTYREVKLRHSTSPTRMTEALQAIWFCTGSAELEKL
jgi:hypothetical protein